MFLLATQHTTYCQDMFLTQQSTVPEMRKRNCSRQLIPPLKHTYQLQICQYLAHPFALYDASAYQALLLSVTTPVFYLTPLTSRKILFKKDHIFIHLFFTLLLRHGLARWMHQHSQVLSLASSNHWSRIDLPDGCDPTLIRLGLITCVVVLILSS